MKNKQLETVLILLLTGSLLALYAFFQPSVSIPLLKGERVDFGFLPFEKMQSLNLNMNANTKADSIADQLSVKSEAVPAEITVVEEADTLKDSSFLTLSNANGKGALDDFFSSLEFESPEKVVRIGHYGDSQIEGDRITSNLRAKFIRAFGGEGVGFVPLQDIAECITYTRESSNNWKRYTVFRDRLKGGAFGLSGMCFVYSGKAKTAGQMEANVSAEEATGSSESKSLATVSLRLRNKYSKMTIQYGKATAPCHVVITKSGSKSPLGEATLQSSEDYVVQEIPIQGNERNITLSFHGPSPLIYGVSFDGEKGIQVDNYGLRGHSGNGLMKINNQLLSKEIQETNTRLLMLQFGANTIPYVKNEKTLHYIAQEFGKLFKKFKNANPNISILVIGVGDMATRINGEYTSYPMIPQIRDVLKKSAIDGGCAYFDLYEFMGGKDAILAWSKKGLASKDGHFSPRGQEIVADEIFNMLNSQFCKFRKRYHINT